MSLTPRFPCDVVPPPETPPVPVSAVVDDVRVTLQFDKPLVDQALFTENWRASGQYPLFAAIVAPDSVQLDFEIAIEPPFDLHYFANPPDVVGSPPNGLEVVPFIFPVS